VVTVSPAPGKPVTAGDTLSWTVTVENKGDGPLRRLRAWTLVDKAPLLDRREFVFGLVKPGEKRQWTVPVKLPKGLDSRHDEVRLHFEDEGGRAPVDALTALDLVEIPKPFFAFSSQVLDETGNGDGLVQRGEEVSLRVDVKNDGPGPTSDKAYVSLKNLGDEKVFIKKGRAVLGTMKPGEVKSAVLQVEVKKGLKGETMPLRVMVVDEKLEEFISERLEVPLAAEGRARTVSPAAVRVTAAEVVLRTGALPEALPIALARKGAILPALGRFGDFVKVEWQKGRTAFARAGDVESAPAKSVPATLAATEVWQRQPPRITVALPETSRGAPVVTAEKIRLEGSAAVPSGAGGIVNKLRDVFVYANDQKVFFKVVPESGASGKMDFAADVPLKPGNNAITIFAREDDEFQTRRTILVYRRGAGEVAQQAAPGAAPPSR
jgi:carboxyl-terminal processing protease